MRQASVPASVASHKVGIAEIAAAAGLTHGAFYTHFESKEALCAEAIGLASGRSLAALESKLKWRAAVEAYLSPKHVRDRANGCPFAALGGDVPREGEMIRTAFSGALEQSIEAVASGLGHAGEGTRREEAIQALATMVGALVLARTASAPRLRDEILGAARDKVLSMSDD
ncbi:MAG: TetR family transcriptional regulator [Betaproteobacteria bacterium]|nr:TetR family transcriptional regulator [Betaproteobacteria bacterium]